MPRTNPAAVQAVLKGNYDGVADLDSEVATASAIVDQVVACAVKKNIALVDSLLERIEAYLAAHLYGHGDQFYKARTTAGAMGQFQGETALGFEGSQYGQTALRMDISGCLQAMNTSARARMRWIGTPAIAINHAGGS